MGEHPPQWLQDPPVKESEQTIDLDFTLPPIREESIEETPVGDSQKGQQEGSQLPEACTSSLANEASMEENPSDVVSEQMDLPRDLPTIFEESMEESADDQQQHSSWEDIPSCSDGGKLNEGTAIDHVNHETDETEEYEVEDVLKARRAKDGEIEYLIKWKDYSSKHNTWQKEQDLNETLKEYVKQKDLPITGRGRPRKE